MHRFPLGTQYLIKRNKSAQLCTVTDQLTVTNSRGDIVREYYTSVHDFCGQTVTNYEVLDTTIALNLTPEFKHLLTHLGIEQSS